LSAARRALALAVVALAAAGCRDLVSADILTEDLRAIIEVRAWDDGAAAVGMELKVHRPWRRWVELSEGDTPYVRREGGAWEEMQPEGFRNRHAYVAWYSDVVPTETFSVKLERADGDVLDGNRLSLPPPFDVEVEPTSVIMGQTDVFVEWGEPSADAMEIELTGGCIFNKRWRIEPGEDEGSMWIPGRDIRPYDSESPSACTATLDLRRTREGEVDGSFKKAEATGVQLRSAVISVTPNW
jgi:hypothetical protein